MHASQTERMPQPGGWLHFDSGWLDTKQILRNLETSVSILQQTQRGILHIQRKIAFGLDFLNTHWEMRSMHSKPLPALDQCMQSIAQQIDDTVRNCKFHGRGLLNGQSSVVGWGNGVGFLRGGPNTKSSPAQGFSVNISIYPTRSVLMGHAPLHPAFMNEEQELILTESDQEIRVLLHKNESPTAFVLRLQTEIWRAGLNLEAQISPSGRLVLQHNHYGSQHIFRGLSRRTSILSQQPGHLEICLKGKDIQGELDGEHAFGVGRMLVGLLDNQRTAELAVCWTGERSLEENKQANCHVVQNSIFVQEAADPHTAIPAITLPWCQPGKLGNWVDSSSGFLSLDHAACHSWFQVKDTIHMLHSVAYELEDWLEKIQGTMKRKQDAAMAKLKYASSVKAQPTATRSLDVFHQKAAQMAWVLQQAMARD